jgi:hypothetical protein
MFWIWNICTASRGELKYLLYLTYDSDQSGTLKADDVIAIFRDVRRPHTSIANPCMLFIYLCRHLERLGKAIEVPRLLFRCFYKYVSNTLVLSLV